jgi:hypothetical protein
MKSRIRSELTTQEMHLAKLLVDGWKHEPAATEAGMNLSTASRRMGEPRFLEYMATLRQVGHNALVKSTEEKMYPLGDNWSRKDSFEGFLEMYKDEKVSAQVRLQALKEATVLLLSKHLAPGEAAEEQEEKAKFYRSEWNVQ